MPVGTSSNISVTLFTTVSLTNLSFTLVAPTNLADWTFTSGNAALEAVTVQAAGTTSPVFTFLTQSGQTLQGTTSLGTIGMTALPGDSAFLTVGATGIIGLEADGNRAGSVSAIPGQVVVVGLHPLLAGSLVGNATRVLTLYGNPGSNYELGFSTNLSSTNWQSAGTIVPTNLQQNLNVNQTAPNAFYRIQ
jgi:hypothetical protein